MGLVGIIVGSNDGPDGELVGIPVGEKVGIFEGVTVKDGIEVFTIDGILDG